MFRILCKKEILCKNMNVLDLDIKKYDLDDILKLFKVERNFGEKELKHAKKIVLMTHPDKSGLHPDYFRFYSNAYKIIYEIWEFKNKSEKDEKAIASESFEMSESQKTVLDKTIKAQKTAKEFNEWFNKEFDKVNVMKDEDENGYGNWLKSDDDVSLSNNLDELDRKKRHLSLMVHKNVNEMTSNCRSGSNLAGDAPETYCSDVFSNLQYEDLHRAHTESVIPVTNEDFDRVQKFNSVDEYKRHRAEVIRAPMLSDIQANEYLKHKTKMEEEYSANRAYKLAKQGEQIRANQQLFWGNLMKLEN